MPKSLVSSSFPPPLVSCLGLLSPATVITDSPDHQAYEKIDLYTRRAAAARAQDFFARVDAQGRALGLAISFTGRVGNTSDSHAMLLLAQRRSQAVLRQLETALYRGAFEQGRDISDRLFLLEAAAQAGLDRDEVLAWLDGEEARRLADGLNRRAREVGIVAVPSFVVQGRYRIGGKQEEKVFLDLFERILRMDEVVAENGDKC